MERAGSLSETGPDLVLRWWRGWDLNPRPSGYEPRSKDFTPTWWAAVRADHGRFRSDRDPPLLPGVYRGAGTYLVHGILLDVTTVGGQMGMGEPSDVGLDRGIVACRNRAGLVERPVW